MENLACLMPFMMPLLSPLSQMTHQYTNADVAVQDIFRGRSAKKESVRRGRDASFVFCGRDWSQGPKRNVVTVALQPLKTVGRFFFRSHAPDRSGYFLVVFLVVFLAAFFFAMALVTSFQQTNVRTAKL
jgi:hypothetical protein